MKVVNIFLVVSTFLLINSSLSINFILESLIIEQRLSTSICKITNGITNSQSDTQDILIGNLGEETWSSTINDIIQCLNDSSAIVVADFKTKMTEERLRKASVVIFVGLNQFDENQLFKLITYSQPPSVYSHTTNIICIVSAASSQNQRIKTLVKFSTFGILNIALVHKEQKGDIIYETLNAQRNSMSVLSNPIRSSLVFPDKLKNLDGFQYEIAALNQPPSVIANESYVSSHMLYFLRTVKKIQNAKFKFNFFYDITTLQDHWIRRKFHLCLNSATVFSSNEKKFMTYGTKNHCALIPIPKMPVFQLVNVEPFSDLIWILFGVSIVCSVAVWRMYQGHGAVDSYWQLAAGIFMMFVGQGANFSRRNRFVLAVLLNIICLAVFLFSTLYETVITSALIEPAHENRLKTVQDLVASDYMINSTEAFAYQYRNSSLYENLAPRLNHSDRFVGAEDIIEQRYVFIMRCDEAENILGRIMDDILPSDYYYMLPEPLTWEFVRLEASYLNPFLDRFQYYMDLSFQAGLPQIWKTFEQQDFSQFFRSKTHNENVLLDLKDLQSVFGIFLVGFSLASFVLLIEIFYHDCFEKMNLKAMAKLFWNQIKRRICRKNRKLKVRRIIVQPRN